MGGTSLCSSSPRKTRRRPDRRPHRQRGRLCDQTIQPGGIRGAAARAHPTVDRGRCRRHRPDPYRGDLVLDEESYEVRRGERLIELTATEFELLRFLMRNPRRVMSRMQILDRVWSYDFGGRSSIVEIYIRIAQKIDAGETPMIRTVAVSATCSRPRDDVLGAPPPPPPPGRSRRVRRRARAVAASRSMDFAAATGAERCRAARAGEHHHRDRERLGPPGVSGGSGSTASSRRRRAGRGRSSARDPRRRRPRDTRASGQRPGMLGAVIIDGAVFAGVLEPSGQEKPLSAAQGSQFLAVPPDGKPVTVNLGGGLRDYRVAVNRLARTCSLSRGCRWAMCRRRATARHRHRHRDRCRARRGRGGGNAHRAPGVAPTIPCHRERVVFADGRWIVVRWRSPFAFRRPMPIPARDRQARRGDQPDDGPRRLRADRAPGKREQGAAIGGGCQPRLRTPLASIADRRTHQARRLGLPDDVVHSIGHVESEAVRMTSLSKTCYARSPRRRPRPAACSCGSGTASGQRRERRTRCRPRARMAPRRSGCPYRGRR